MLEAVEANKKGKKQKVFQLKAYKFDENSQDVYLLPTMPIIARMGNEEFDFMNNETFIIRKVSEEFISVYNNDVEGRGTIDIPTQDFTKYFNVAFCVTCHKAQGCSFDHPYTIYEWNRFDSRLKYVALSRSTKREYIDLI